MIRTIALALIAAGAGFVFAALVATQPDRPAIIPGTIYSTWKVAR